jgi:hypothetical protein
MVPSSAGGSGIRDTIYLLGAGFNRCLRDSEGRTPPLVREFFQVGLQLPRLRSDQYRRRLESVLAYIERHWSYGVEDLQQREFNIEDLLTKIDEEVDAAEDMDEKAHLMGLQLRIEWFIAEVLSEFRIYLGEDHLMRRFGRRVLAEHATVISFNYDTLLEEAIEGASMVNSSTVSISMPGQPVSESELRYSHYNWNRPLAYSIHFDDVKLQRAGTPTFVPGSRFYSDSGNKLYQAPILKLHGSLNWFRYMPHRKYANPYEPAQVLPQALRESLILTDGHWWFNEPPDRDGWVIDPVLVTPTRYKEKFYRTPPFPRLWAEAQERLRGSSRMVIIGYSFAAGDSTVADLLTASLRDRTGYEVTVVDPNSKVVEAVRDLLPQAQVASNDDIAGFFKTARERDAVIPAVDTLPAALSYWTDRQLTGFAMVVAGPEAYQLSVHGADEGLLFRAKNAAALAVSWDELRKLRRAKKVSVLWKSVLVYDRPPNEDSEFALSIVASTMGIELRSQSEGSWWENVLVRVSWAGIRRMQADIEQGRWNPQRYLDLPPYEPIMLTVSREF